METPVSPTSRVGHRPLLRYVTRRVVDVQVTPARITLAYVALGLVGLYVSDVVFVRLLEDPVLSEAQALKGFVEIGLTGAFVFGLTKRAEVQHREKSRRVETQREELDLLHRVLRHNLRNDLNVVNGYADLLSNRVPDESSRTECERIVDTTRKMIEYTEKAHLIRRVSEAARRQVTIDLANELPRHLDSLDASSIDVSIDPAEGCVVDAHPMLPEAVREVLHNAIEHARTDDPTVRLDVNPTDTGLVEVRISDDGPGIPESELEPLRTGRETPLEHTSNLGLWFVKWAVDHSNGELGIESTDDGTTVRMILPAALDLDVPSREDVLGTIDAGEAA